MKLVPRKEREVPEDLRWAWDRAYAAVKAGVDWQGNVETVGGLTKDEALQVADEFLDAFSAWLKDVP